MHIKKCVVYLFFRFVFDCIILLYFKLLPLTGYPSCIDWECSYEQTMEHLIREVEAGADFIITQMVFDASDFFKFVTKCRENDISVPIIPGIFPIQVKPLFPTPTIGLVQIIDPKRSEYCKVETCLFLSMFGST